MSEEASVFCAIGGYGQISYFVCVMSMWTIFHLQVGLINVPLERLLLHRCQEVDHEMNLKTYRVEENVFDRTYCA